MLDLLLSQSELDIRDEARAFAAGVPADLLRRMDRDEVEYPREFVEEAAAKGLLGLHFPVEYGGRGGNWTADAMAVGEVGVLGIALACAYSMPTIVGEAINTFGTPDQKEKYLKGILCGKLISAECLTEPRGGSDFFGTTTTAVKRGDKWILNGQKRFIVGGMGADVFLVYARTNPDVDAKLGLTAFLVDRCEGVKTEHKFELMGCRGAGTARLRFNNVEVPAHNVLGGPDLVDKGAAVFARMMVPERLTSAAGTIGGAEAAIRAAGTYANKRKAFGQKIAAFQGVSFKIAESLTKLDAMAALVVAAARAADADVDGRRTRRLISEAKSFATQGCWDIVNECMQVFGGIGYTNVFPLERALRDTRLGMIWTGSNEVMKAVIAHEYYHELLGSRSTQRDTSDDTLGYRYESEIVYE